MASFFSSLFGGSRKQNYGDLIPNPPAFSYAPGSTDQYSGGIQNLIDLFTQKSEGKGLFDALQYVYGPQANELRQNYGIDTNPGDIFSQRTGALPQTLASLNKRGLLDTGTSGIIEGQLRSNLSNELARAYGGAKQQQSQEQTASLDALHQLFPERFQAQNLQTQADYQNQMNNYNALLQRNQATVAQQAQMDQNTASRNQSLFGLGLSAFGGGLQGAGTFGSFGQLGTGLGAFGQGALGNVTGAYNPTQQYALQNIFGNKNQNQTSSLPGFGGSPLLKSFYSQSRPNYDQPFSSTGLF